MLDLSVSFGLNLYDIKLFDGTILHLMRPTQGLQQAVLDLVKLLQDGTKQQDAAAIMVNIFLQILNRNNDGKTFTKQDIEENYNLTIISYVIKDYFAHWNKEISESVNFQNAQQ